MDTRSSEKSIISREIYVGFWGMYEFLCDGNRMLTKPRFDHVLNENCYKKYNELYTTAKNQGIKIESLDMVENFSDVDCFLFSGPPNPKSKLVKRAMACDKPMLLIIEEPETVTRRGWSKEDHSIYDAVFTWYDDWVDNEKYFKFNVFHIEDPPEITSLSHKNKFCVLIAGNKRSTHPQELYSERIRTIRWFEKNYPNDFDLFGYDWDELIFPIDIPLVSRLNSKKISWFRKSLFKLTTPHFPSWGGVVKDKRPVLARYWFCICYENMRDVPGYVFEKIFDCFYSGTVPVYWGGSNVCDIIPSNCFIDRRQFKTHEELYKFLKNISETQYFEYLENVSTFLKSPNANSFSAQYFSETIIKQIVKATSKTR